MKVTFLLTALMLFAFTGCGDKKSNSTAGTGYFTNALTTLEGFYEVQTGRLIVGGQQVIIQDAQSNQVLQMAMMQAQQRMLQPRMLGNGSYGFNARVTGQTMNYGGYNMGYGQGGFQGGYNNMPGYGVGVNQPVVLSSVQFY